MTRIAVVAPKAAQEEVIEAIHGCRLAHIEEFSRVDEVDLDIGEPLEASSEASEILVRLRAIIHATGLEPGDVPTQPLHQDIIHERLANDLDEIEAEVEKATARRDEIARELETIRDQLNRLEPISQLPLELEDYRGYESLRVFVGIAPRDLSEELSIAIERFEYFGSAGAHAVFVHLDEAEKAQEILAREGFRELEVPEADGQVRQAVQRLSQRREELSTKLEDARARLTEIAKEHGNFILAAEEDLSIQVEKAEAPLNFASTERAFIVDAWVPQDEATSLENQVREAAGGAVHFEIIDDGDRDAHREQEPPTKYDHPKGVRKFSFLLDLFSTPKYAEIDPTVILFLVFPFFFGFMIGDLGYGILMVALGFFLYRRIGPKSEAAGSLGFALLLSGIWATLFGAIVFHDALGIPYAAHGHAEGLNWEGLLGIHLNAGEPLLEKLGDEGVKGMLALSIVAAFVHLFVGFIFGFINHLRHNAKHAFAQIGWMGVLVGLFLVGIIYAPENEVSHFLMGAMGEPTIQSSLYFLGPGVLVLIVTEGFMGAMEVLGLFSNVISYTRLAGVAVAKGAMAGAFNFIFLEGMALHGDGAIIVVIGFLLFVLAQLIVFVLGMISSGIQGIRLNYVEFFLKFYEGGGEAFKPFGRDREFTLTPTTTR
ncbi:MAG: V-type ATP synthase subunit I [Candidatus Thermoplasmatota archaeon]|nr:V-type ATP synthase subunit I [Candidatus Thermoplasmatota archaeon]